MTESMKCPKCSALLPSNAPSGICPRCLIRAGLTDEFDTDSSPNEAERTVVTPLSAGFVPPDIADLAPHFPQLELIELLGHGGMGAVYKARQTKLDRLVALKIIKPDTAADANFAERFTREAKTLARLNHSNIVGVHDFGEAHVTFDESYEDRARSGRSQTLYYFIMEYVDGANLRQLLESKELSPEQGLTIVPQICDALQYAHDEGVIHRDVKPENILVDKRGRVKIADFGLARLVDSSAQDFTLTGTHQVMGTPRYMAPEQMTGSRHVDHRADIYSLGVVLYELLTGEVPMGRFEPPSKRAPVDGRLDEVVLRALEREPDRRYQQASELKSGVELISSASGSWKQPAAGFSTIAQREFQNAWRWVAGSTSESTDEAPTMPARLLIVLSIAGCLMVSLPWMTLEIPSSTMLRGSPVQLEKAIKHEYFGTSFWPGPVVAAALGAFALFSMVTFGQRRLSLLVGTILSALAGVAVVCSLLYKVELERPRRHIRVGREITSVRRPPVKKGATVNQLVGGPSVTRFTGQTVALDDIQHELRFEWGYYGVVGLSSVLLVFSLIVERHAIGRIGSNKTQDGHVTDPPLTNLRFALPPESDIGPQILFHFCELGYELKEESPGYWRFQRGSKMGSMMSTDIRAFLTTLSVRTATVIDDELLVSCSWAVKSMGSWISKRDIRRLEDEGRELRAMLGGYDPATGLSST